MQKKSMGQSLRDLSGAHLAQQERQTAAARAMAPKRRHMMLYRQRAEYLADYEKAARAMLAALKQTEDEIRRLHAVHGSYYSGKIGEPDMAVVDVARAAIARAEAAGITA